VVPQDTRVQLHDETVLGRHHRRLVQHVARERLGVLRRHVTLQRAGVDPLRFRIGQRDGGGGEVAVVCCPGARGDERLATLPESFQESVVRRGVDVGQCTELADELRPAVSVDVRDGVRAEGRHDPAGQVGGQLRVLGEVVGGRVGGGDQLDVEPIQQRSRPEAGLRDPRHDLVVQLVGGLRGRVHRQPEHLRELVLQPVAARRAEEEVPVGAELAPDLPRLGGVPAVAAGESELVGGDALGDQHPGHVVVRHDQQLGRVAERRVGGEQPDVDVTVQAQQRQVLRRGVDPAGDVPRGAGRQGAVRMGLQSLRH